MATSTTKYGFTKPAATEYYDVAVQNQNMDAIEAALSGLITIGSLPIIDGASALLTGTPRAVLVFWDTRAYLLTGDVPGAYLQGHEGATNYIYISLGDTLAITTSGTGVSLTVRYVVLR